MHDPSPPLTSDEYLKLKEIGVLGSPSHLRTELIDGRIAWPTRYPLGFRMEAVRVAAAHGIKLRSCVDEVLAD